MYVAHSFSSSTWASHYGYLTTRGSVLLDWKGFMHFISWSDVSSWWLYDKLTLWNESQEVSGSKRK